jgi:hypothetical protein
MGKILGIHASAPCRGGRGRAVDALPARRKVICALQVPALDPDDVLHERPEVAAKRVR